MIKVGIIGLNGRMGHMLWQECSRYEDLKIVCGVCKAGPALPQGCEVEVKEQVSELKTLPDVFIDFSRPEATLALLDFACEHKIAVVIGTTGFDEAGKARISQAAEVIPVVLAANFSVGVNVLLSLVEKAAAILADYDLEIVEAHHKHKVDAPSGTALAIGQAAAAGRKVELKDVMVSGRDGITGERQPGSIGFAAIRGGDIVGEHQALFCGEGERVELGHIATSRAIFAQGAVKTARWLFGKAPKLYTLKEVLGLDRL
ncbi:MAG: 4-hydroxy-tetrahydrodipicolinate reductase [Succinivibrio sp.]|nr:4-hydroxy-tetrahydrodipicolinate reductase [Succinivibrio sp.]